MANEGTSSIALIVGSVGTLLTMAVHPTTSASMTREAYEQLARVSAWAHGIGIVSVALLFLGACGLTERFRAPNRLALAAHISLALASIAAVIAATISGYIEPRLMLRMVQSAQPYTAQWGIVIDAIFQINQAFAQIFTVSTAAAVVLWSCAAWRLEGMPRWMALYGCLVAPVPSLGLLAGLLRMDLHGATLAVLVPVIWFVSIGVHGLKLRTRAEPLAQVREQPRDAPYRR